MHEILKHEKLRTAFKHFLDDLKDLDSDLDDSPQQLQQNFQFYTEVQHFSSIPYSQSVYVYSQAQKIFEKFVRRGAKNELRLPAEVRRSVIADLSQPHLTMFNEAQESILQVMIFHQHACCRTCTWFVLL
jgi:hypothetical protein